MNPNSFQLPVERKAEEPRAASGRHRRRHRPCNRSSTATNPTSAARIEANRANAQLSTGPTSPEGKAKVSVNAVKSGLTGRTVLLPTDDVAAYEALIAEVTAKWQPAITEEQRLTQALAYGRPRFSASRRFQKGWRFASHTSGRSARCAGG